MSTQKFGGFYTDDDEAEEERRTVSKEKPRAPKPQLTPVVSDKSRRRHPSNRSSAHPGRPKCAYVDNYARDENDESDDEEEEEEEEGEEEAEAEEEEEEGEEEEAEKVREEENNDPKDEVRAVVQDKVAKTSNHHGGKSKKLVKGTTRQQSTANQNVHPEQSHSHPDKCGIWHNSNASRASDDSDFDVFSEHSAQNDDKMSRIGHLKKRSLDPTPYDSAAEEDEEEYLSTRGATKMTGVGDDHGGIVNPSSTVGSSLPPPPPVVVANERRRFSDYCITPLEGHIECEESDRCPVQPPRWLTFLCVTGFGPDLGTLMSNHLVAIWPRMPQRRRQKEGRLEANQNNDDKLTNLYRQLEQANEDLRCSVHEETSKQHLALIAKRDRLSGRIHGLLAKNPALVPTFRYYEGLARLVTTGDNRANAAFDARSALSSPSLVNSFSADAPILAVPTAASSKKSRVATTTQTSDRGFQVSSKPSGVRIDNDDTLSRSPPTSHPGLSSRNASSGIADFYQTLIESDAGDAAPATATDPNYASTAANRSAMGANKNRSARDDVPRRTLGRRLQKLHARLEHGESIPIDHISNGALLALSQHYAAVQNTQMLTELVKRLVEQLPTGDRPQSPDSSFISPPLSPNDEYVGASPTLLLNREYFSNMSSPSTPPHTPLLPITEILESEIALANGRRAQSQQHQQQQPQGACGAGAGGSKKVADPPAAANKKSGFSSFLERFGLGFGNSADTANTSSAAATTSDRTAARVDEKDQDEMSSGDEMSEDYKKCASHAANEARRNDKKRLRFLSSDDKHSSEHDENNDNDADGDDDDNDDDDDGDAQLKHPAAKRKSKIDHQITLRDHSTMSLGHVDPELLFADPPKKRR